jgi:beta-glucosidase
LPQALEDAGGWPNRDTANRFADYAEIMMKALGDRVNHWVMLNEPKTFTSCGYWYGIHAPGRQDPLAFVRSTHTANLAQGLAFRAMKAVRPAAQIGSAFDVAPMYPFSQSPEDIAAAERWHRFQNLWFVYPALQGRYPDGVLPRERQIDLLGFKDGDGKLLRAPLDFIGLNYYTPVLVKHNPQGNGIPGLNTENIWATMHGVTNKSDLGWAIYPQGFYDVLMQMHTELGNRPIEITENGGAFNTPPNATGKIDDDARIDYLRGHLLAMSRAMQQGVPIRAYHCWSLLDNFEWAEGYSQRFGIVYVDFDKAQKRTMKASGRWYSDIARTNVIR